jgi:hypothetical protein
MRFRDLVEAIESGNGRNDQEVAITSDGLSRTMNVDPSYL